MAHKMRLVVVETVEYQALLVMVFHMAAAAAEVLEVITVIVTYLAVTVVEVMAVT